MKNYFIPHKLKVGDITHLSDEDSEIIISKDLHRIEDPVEIYNLDSLFLGIVTDITKSSIEVEIVKKNEDLKRELNKFHITLIQSISNDPKFNFALEKAVEIGVHRIIPVESKYSTQTQKRSLKKYGVWKKIISDAKEQSRCLHPVELEKPIKIKDLVNTNSKHKICLSTEAVTSKNLSSVLKNKAADSSYTIAIGPEKGWSSSDLKVFEELNFEFARMGRNILRTETGGLVISSILNFRTGIY